MARKFFKISSNSNLFRLELKKLQSEINILQKKTNSFAFKDFVLLFANLFNLYILYTLNGLTDKFTKQLAQIGDIFLDKYFLRVNQMVLESKVETVQSLEQPISAGGEEQALTFWSKCTETFLSPSVYYPTLITIALLGVCFFYYVNRSGSGSAGVASADSINGTDMTQLVNLSNSSLINASSDLVLSDKNLSSTVSQNPSFFGDGFFGFFGNEFFATVEKSTFDVIVRRNASGEVFTEIVDSAKDTSALCSSENIDVSAIVRALDAKMKEDPTFGGDISGFFH